MKKLLSMMAGLLLTAISVYSQAPGIFNYQGVARNSVGNALINKTITLRLTIHDATAGGAIVYQESRLATTNPFGLFNVQVGSPGATSVTGTVAGVNWAVNSKFIQVEIDPNGGSTFINIGTAQIASVPYAYFSAVSTDLVLPFNKTQADNGTLFKITNSGNASGSTALEGATNSTAANAFAIIGSVTSGTPGSNSAGVRGMNGGTGALGIGVWGSHAGGGWGVYGTAVSGIGVRGESNSGMGVYGTSNSGNAGRFENTNAANLADALFASTNGGVSSWALRATSTGAQGAGIFTYNNAAGTANTIRVTNNGSGSAVSALSTGTGYALNTSGRIQLTGINEGLNKVLASDAVGNATWQTLAAIGGVTGSGTVNFVPKWTPVGTNLGNSQIFDNGTSVGINTSTPDAAYRLEVQGIQRINNTTLQEGGELRFQEGTLFGAPNHWIIDNFESFAGGNKFRIWNDAGSMSLQMMPTGRVAVGPMVFSDQPQSNLDVEGNLAVGATYSGTNAAPVNGMIVEGNVGIGTPTPTAKLHLLNSSAAVLGSLLINQSNASNSAIGVNIFDANTSSVAYGNGAVYAQRGAGSLANTFLYTGIATAITGVAASPVGFGVQGTSESGYGVTGLSYSGISVHGINLNSGNAARFENALNAGNTAPVVFVNSISTVAGVYGVHSVIASTAPGGSSTALRGQNNGLGGLGIGVYGSQNGSGWGVLGTAPNGLGVYGSTTDGVGVWGEATNNGWAVRAAANTNTAIFSTSNTGWAGDFRSQMNYAGLFQTTNIGNNIATLVSVNASPQPFARALYAQGSGYSGYFYVPGQVSEFQADGTSGVVSISRNFNSMVTATETGNGLYSQILNTTGFGNAAVLGVSSNPNSHGLYGIAPNGGIGRALVTSGPLQLTGIGEANNRVLASDPVGNATWKTLASIGAVSGSGTLNYVPKWTPSGTNLGNSQIFDNGVAVGIGPAAPFWNLDIASNVTVLRLRDLDDATEVDMVAPGFGYTGGFGTPLNLDVPLYTNNVDRLTVKAGTGDVGIGTATTTARLEVLQTGLTGVINATNSNVANISNGISSINVNATAGATNPTTGGGAALFARKGAPLGTYLTNPTSIYATTSNAGTVAVAGFGGAGTYGVAGLAASAGAVGVLGETFTAGTTGIFALGSAGATALLTSGAIRLAGIGEANGYVLTSDASGNATWMGPASITVRTFSSNVAVPSGIDVPITQWNTILNEDGGANYNSVTGEYTIPITGYYQVNASILWDVLPANSSAVLSLWVNGAFEYQGYSTGNSSVASSSSLAQGRRYNVGDKLRFYAKQWTGVPQTLTGAYYGQSFSVELIHR